MRFILRFTFFSDLINPRLDKTGFARAPARPVHHRAVFYRKTVTEQYNSVLFRHNDINVALSRFPKMFRLNTIPQRFVRWNKVNNYAVRSVTVRAASSLSDPQRPNRSFLMNMFGGKLETTELFPYPEPLNAEQKEFAAALVDPVHKFFTVSVIAMRHFSLTALF